MKKIYWIIAAAMLVTAACIFLTNKKAEAGIPGLLDRKGAIATSAEWLNSKKAIDGLLYELRNNPDNNKAKLALAQAYMQEARVTGEHPYYYPAALDLLEDVLDDDPENYEALCCKSSVLLSQHRFSEALKPAMKAREVNPNNSFVYGLMCDAYVELGDYTKAIEMGDKMVQMRPDLKSYSRISYLREIHGDISGAIEAMKLAVSAGFPGLEQTAWARVTLGQLYENKGELSNAEQHYNLALEERANYAFAYAGLGRIAQSKKEYEKAIRYNEQAANIIPEFSFHSALAELYELSGQTSRAKQTAAAVIEMLKEDEESGHLCDRELAYAYMQMGENTKALRHAKNELKRRPENIDANEVMAWALYNNKRYEEANEYMQKALRTNSKNPHLLQRAVKVRNAVAIAGIVY